MRSDAISANLLAPTSSPKTLCVIECAARGLPGGLAGRVSHLVYRQVLGMYGIDHGALPGFDQAQGVEPLDVRLAPSFVSLTNDPAAARQCLNPWAVTPLAQWVEQHPMKHVQSSGQPVGQLIVLFSPEGTFLTWLNVATPEQVEAVTGLGVDLVRAQGAA